jgi:hypothetical protein
MRQRSIGYFGAIAIAMAPMVFGQEQTPVSERETPPQSTTQERPTIEGDVVEVNAQMLTVLTVDGRTMTFSVDRDLTAGVEPITLGSRVRVEYSGEQQLVAMNVSRLRIPDQDPDDNGGVETARVETTPQTTPAASQRDELPGTASPLPMMLVTGLALLGSGLGLSVRRRA